MTVRTGRRPGPGDTRETILRAARDRFRTDGYTRATMRAIAADAGVDPKMVHHWFGTKERLFVAAVELPFRPREVFPALLRGPRSTLGERIAGFVVSVAEDPARIAPLLALVRSAASHDDAAEMLRGFVTEELLGPLADALDVEDARLRATLVGSQVIGMVMARYVVRVEPLASADPEVLVPALGGTIQRYLLGDIATAGGRRRR